MIALNLLAGIMISSVVIASGNTTKPGRPVRHKTAWVLIDETEHLSIEERWLTLNSGQETRERKGTFYINASRTEIVNAVASAKGIASWMRGVEEARELKLNDSATKVVYVHFDAPWPFKDRDLITEIRTIQNCDTPCTEVLMTAMANYLPEKERIARLKSYEATWTITEHENGIFKVVYTAYSATKPVAPKWIQDPVTLKLFRDNLLNLKDLLTEKDQ